MRKPLLFAILIMATAGSTFAQTTDFFEQVKTGTPQSAEAVIDKGTDVNAQDKEGRTALMAAARYNQNPSVITHS